MKNIALTGGGTGGHIFPLLSIYNYLKKDSRDLNFIWYGDEMGLENDVAYDYDIDFYHIPSGKIRRYFSILNFFEPLKNLSGIFFALYYIKKHDIDIIFSKGGYVSVPLCIAGFILRKKVYIHESDMVFGASNKFISRFATKIYYTFPDEAIIDPKFIQSGPIINIELFKNLTGLGNIEQNERLEALVVGGSQGSTRIFEAVKSILNNIPEVNFTIVLGEKNLFMAPEFEGYPNVKVYDFVDQSTMGELYKNTDIAISRAGSNTLWELYFFGIHTVIVPLPESAGNHQQRNAEYFSKNFKSDIVYEGDDLNVQIYRLLSTYKNMRKSGLNLSKSLKALDMIKDEILGDSTN